MKIKKDIDVESLYSVYVKQGPDMIHYDLYVEDKKIIAKYLGEHWEYMRPRTGLGRAQDLFLYRLRKRRERARVSLSRDDIIIDICGIEVISLVKRGNEVVLRIKTRQGVYEFNSTIKIIDLLKKFVKKVKNIYREECGRKG